MFLQSRWRQSASFELVMKTRSPIYSVTIVFAVVRVLALLLSFACYRCRCHSCAISVTHLRCLSPQASWVVVHTNDSENSIAGYAAKRKWVHSLAKHCCVMMNSSCNFCRPAVLPSVLARGRLCLFGCKKEHARRWYSSGKCMQSKNQEQDLQRAHRCKRYVTFIHVRLPVYTVCCILRRRRTRNEAARAKIFGRRVYTI